MPKLRTNLAFDVSIGAISGKSEAIDAISQSLEDSLVGALSGTSLNKVQKELNGTFKKAYIGAQTAGLRGHAKAFKKSYDKDLKNLKKKADLWQEYQAEFAKATSDADKKSLQKKSDAVKREIASLQIALKRRIAQQESATEQQGELLEEYEKRANKTRAERMKDYSEGFAELTSKAMTLDNLDPSSLVTGLGAAFQKVAPNLAAKGAEMAAGGGVKGMLGEAAVALSASAAAIAGAAAAIGAVVAVFAAAYGQTKEFNKEILSGASGLDLMNDASGDLGNSLKEVRDAAMETAGNFRVGTSEVIGYLTAVNKSNLTFKEMRKTFGTIGTAQEAYTNTASTVIRQMQVFGASADEVGKELHFMVDGLGMGLESINDAFTTMFQGAKMSGLSVNDFFNSVNEATSGMARMNFRMEDTVAMLVAMEDILGEDMAKDMAKYTKKYKEMSTVDRMKTVMTSGALGGKVLRAQAGAQSQAFTRDVSNDPKALGALITAGLGKMGKEGFELDEQKIASLTGTELGKYQNLLGGALGERLGELSETLRGSRKGASLGQRAGALGNLDRAGEMAMDMASAFAVLGNQGMDTMEGLDRAAFESITGIQGEMFEAYQDIQRRVGARLEEEGKGTGKGGKATLSDVATAIASGEMLSQEDRKALLEAKESGMTEMEKIANQQLVETTSISQVLKNNIVTTLETVSGYLEVLTGLLPKNTINDPAVEVAKRKAEVGRQIGQMSELKTVLQGELDKFVKEGGDVNSRQYRDMQGRIRATDEAISGMRQAQYTATGEYSSDTGGAVLKAYGVGNVSAEMAESAGLGDKLVDSSTKEGSGYLGDLIGGEEVKVLLGSGFQDSLVIKDLVDYSGKSAEYGFNTEKSNEAMAEESDKQTKLQKKLLKAIDNQWSRKALAEISGATGISPGELSEALEKSAGGLTSLATGSGKSLSDDVMAQIQFLEAQRKDMVGDASFDDFIYQNGVATGIDNKDVIGAKPGGALSKLGVGFGGSRVVNINVNGGNTAEVMRVVRQAVRTAE